MNVRLREHSAKCSRLSLLTAAESTAVMFRRKGTERYQSQVVTSKEGKTNLKYGLKSEKL